MISAERGHGVEDLRRWLAGQVPEGPWLYPEDQIADLPLRLIAAETTREKLTLRLHQELPYELTVETEGWEERKDGSVKIDQVVYVARDGHKGITLGPKGETIKAVGKAAREEIKAFLGREVHLFLTVKVRPELAGGARALRRDRARLPRRRRGERAAADRGVLGAGLSGAAAARRHPGLRDRARRRDGGGGGGEAQHARRRGARPSRAATTPTGARVWTPLAEGPEAGGGRGAGAAAAVRPGPLGDRGRGPAGAAPARRAGAGGVGSARWTGATRAS